MFHPFSKEHRSAARSWARYWPAGLAIACGLGFSLVVYFMLSRWEARKIETAFRVEAADRATAVKTAFEAQVSKLESVQAAFSGIPQVRRDEFDKLLDPFRKHGESIFAVEWAPRVSRNQRRKYEEAARKEGIEGFQFTEVDSNGKVVPAVERDEYFPIYYIGPKPGNPVVFGYDLASEPTRLEAVRKARDTGKAQASGRIAFIQDEKAGTGFLILLPVYERGKPVESVEDRRQNFRGVVMGVFRPDILIESAIAELQPEGIDVCLFDSSEPGKNQKPFYYHASRDRKEATEDIILAIRNDPGEKQYRSELDVAGHRWTIECISIPEFIDARTTDWPRLTLLAGMAFTAILAAYVMSSIDRKAFADRLVQEKRLYARGLESKVYERTESLRLAQEEIIQRLVTASLWRDEETGMHIRRTGLLSEALAKAAGWSTAETDMLRLAAPMHDVGKIGIPDAILRKPGRLNSDEFDVIKTHTLIGAEMLADSKIPMLLMAREIALNHHEYWDGNGYPTGMSGLDIPESARILAIIDVYDALTHDRVYRTAMSEDEALEIMRNEAGTHFDPNLLALFFTILPEINRISRENPDDLDRNLRLARAFASVLARSSTGTLNMTIPADAAFSQPQST